MRGFSTLPNHFFIKGIFKGLQRVKKWWGMSGFPTLPRYFFIKGIFKGL